MPADLVTLEKQITGVNTAADLSELTAQILVNVADNTGHSAEHLKTVADNAGHSAEHLKTVADNTGHSAEHLKTVADNAGHSAEHLKTVADNTGHSAGHLETAALNLGRLAEHSFSSGHHLASIARRGSEDDPIYARVELHRVTFEIIRALLTEFCGTPKSEMGELTAQYEVLELRLQELELKHQALMERFESHHHTGSRRGPVNDTE